jgi:hypothetical protein
MTAGMSFRSHRRIAVRNKIKMTANGAAVSSATMVTAPPGCRKQTIEIFLQRFWDIDCQRIFGRLIEHIHWTVFGAYQGREESAGRTS